MFYSGSRPKYNVLEFMVHHEGVGNYTDDTGTYSGPVKVHCDNTYTLTPDITNVYTIGKLSGLRAHADCLSNGRWFNGLTLSIDGTSTTNEIHLSCSFPVGCDKFDEDGSGAAYSVYFTGGTPYRTSDDTVWANPEDVVWNSLNCGQDQPQS